VAFRMAKAGLRRSPLFALAPAGALIESAERQR
jgi:hypothetical protein